MQHLKTDTQSQKAMWISFDHVIYSINFDVIHTAQPSAVHLCYTKSKNVWTEVMSYAGIQRKRIYRHNFITRQYTDARYWYSNFVCLSVRLSVRDVPVSDENGLTYLFTTR